jgi:hypothetical protein
MGCQLLVEDFEDRRLAGSPVTEDADSDRVEPLTIDGLDQWCGDVAESQQVKRGRIVRPEAQWVCDRC